MVWLISVFFIYIIDFIHFVGYFGGGNSTLVMSFLLNHNILCG